MTHTTTPGQRFAAEYGAHAVEQMLSTIKWVARLAALITAIAMVTNYGHQRGYLLSLGVESLTAHLVPVSVDLLTILCIKVISTPGMVRFARRAALVALAFPVTASAAISGSAPGSTAAKAVYVVAVVMIAVAEGIKSTIRPDFDALLTAEAAVTPTATTQSAPSPARSDAARRAAVTRKANTEAKVAAEAERRERRRLARQTRELESMTAGYVPEDAPVSPAPVA